MIGHVANELRHHKFREDRKVFPTSIHGGFVIRLFFGSSSLENWTAIKKLLNFGFSSIFRAFDFFSMFKIDKIDLITEMDKNGHLNCAFNFFSSHGSKV